MSQLSLILVTYLLIFNVMLFGSIASYSLKIDNEPLEYIRCRQHNLDVWHTADNLKIAYIPDNDVLVETPESRILTHPQNSDETDLQTYFLEKQFYFVDLFLDNPSYAALDAVPHHRWKRILRHVVTWMTEHKFLETDPRVFAKLAEVPEQRSFQRVLYRQFPVPVLKDFHPIVQEACEKGLLFCLKLIHEYAVAHVQRFNKYLNSDKSYFSRQYGQLRMNNRHSLELTRLALTQAKNSFCEVQADIGWTWFSGQTYAPFLSRNDLFEFRTTASYYLCNYTLSQRRLYEHLSYPGSPENYHAYPGTGRQKAIECVPHGRSDARTFRRSNLAYTLATLYGFPCNKVGLCQLPIGDKVGRKYQDDASFWDFSCVMLAFCPDVCCGAYANPLINPTDINRCAKQDPDYPCRDGAQNDNCDYDVKRNTNFFDLIQNHVNISCGCNEKEGKAWDTVLVTCVDIDECLASASPPCKRDSEVCINRLNGLQPLCVCEFGYYRRDGIGPCVVDAQNGLFQYIDDAEVRMKQLYGPIEEGKAPVTSLGGKDAEAEAVKMALGNIGAVLKLKSTGSRLRMSTVCLVLFVVSCFKTYFNVHFVGLRVRQWCMVVVYLCH